jgi:hypothetical protein
MRGDGEIRHLAESMLSAHVARVANDLDDLDRIKEAFIDRVMEQLRDGALASLSVSELLDRFQDMVQLQQVLVSKQPPLLTPPPHVEAVIELTDEQMRQMLEDDMQTRQGLPPPRRPVP